MDFPEQGLFLQGYGTLEEPGEVEVADVWVQHAPGGVRLEPEVDGNGVGAAVHLVPVALWDEQHVASLYKHAISDHACHFCAIFKRGHSKLIS